MRQENEIQELKERLNSVEGQLAKKSNGFKTLKIGIIIVLVIFLLLVLIGVLQFVSAG